MFLEEIMNEVAVKAARKVMNRHIEALNSLDEDGLASTLHFPHYRLVGAKLDCWQSKETYLTDFRVRAGDNWARSVWKSIKVEQSSQEKVHLLAHIVRYDNNNNTIAEFHSLWVITAIEGKWAAQFRSSFASA